MRLLMDEKEEENSINENVHSKPINIHETTRIAELIDLRLRVRCTAEACAEVVWCCGFREVEDILLRCATTNPRRFRVGQIRSVEVEVKRRSLPLLNPFAMNRLQERVVRGGTRIITFLVTAFLRLELVTFLRGQARRDGCAQ